MLGGRAADLLGRRRLFVAGVALFSVASLFNGLAQSSTMLIVGRGVQGLGAALVSPAALSIIIDDVQDTGERTKALGVWSAIAAGGAAFGLLLGGVLTDLVSWQWIFFVNVPVGIADGRAGAAATCPSRAPTSDTARSTSPGRRRVTGGPDGRWCSGSSRRRRGAGAPADASRACSAVGVLLLAAFVAIEARSTRR